MSKNKPKETFFQKLMREELQEIVADRNVFLVRIKPEDAKWAIEKLKAFLDSGDKSTTLFLKFDDKYRITILDMKYHPNCIDENPYKPMEYKALQKMEEWPSPA